MFLTFDYISNIWSPFYYVILKHTFDQFSVIL